MAWFRVHVLMQAAGGEPEADHVLARELEYAVAAMDAMEAEDKAETLALRACSAAAASASVQRHAWRCRGSVKTVKFSNSAMPLNDVEDGECLSAHTLSFSDEASLMQYLVGQGAPLHVQPER